MMVKFFFTADVGNLKCVLTEINVISLVRYILENLYSNVKFKLRFEMYSDIYVCMCVCKY